MNEGLPIDRAGPRDVVQIGRTPLSSFLYSFRTTQGHLAKFANFVLLRQDSLLVSAVFSLSKNEKWLDYYGEVMKAEESTRQRFSIFFGPRTSRFVKKKLRTSDIFLTTNFYYKELSRKLVVTFCVLSTDHKLRRSKLSKFFSWIGKMSADQQNFSADHQWSVGPAVENS